MAAKYRPLNKEELTSLEKEFVDYLVINGITAEDWEKLKTEEHHKAEKILELFSDVVWEGILRKTEYLVQYDQSFVYAFHFLSAQVQLVGLEDTGNSTDFTKRDVFKQLEMEMPEGLTIFHQDKKYESNREREIFDMIEKGAQVSDGKLFKQLSLLYATVHSK